MDAQTLLHWVEGVRLDFSARLAPHDPSGVFRGLWLTQLTEDKREQFLRVLGFVHLVRASGIHLYATYGVVRSAIHWAAIGLHWLRIRLPIAWVVWVARALAIAAVLWGWALCGFRLGMLRPLIVVGLRFGVRTMGGKWAWWAPLTFALLVDVAWGWWINDPGLGRLHYALAVGGGLAALELVRDGSEFRKHVAMSVGSWLPTAVVDVVEHHWIQFSIPALSLITIPVFAGLLYPMGLLVASWPSSTMHSLFFKSCDFAQWLLEVLMGIVLDLPLLWIVRPWQLLVTAVLVFLVVQFRIGIKPMSCIVFAMTVLRFAVVPLLPDWTGTAVVQVDVGQGDAAWIATRGRRGFIDVGSRRGKSMAGWMTFLANHSNGRINFVALTHGDEDHAGGLDLLRMLLPIECVAAHPAIDLPVAQPVGSGCEPFPAWILPENSARKSGNRHMVAYWVDGYANAGDASVHQEEWWIKALKTHGYWRDLRVWKVSHHGSRFSTPALEKMGTMSQVKAIWISVGAFNRYGHPHPEVMDKLGQSGVRILRTDVIGDISYINEDATK